MSRPAITRADWLVALKAAIEPVGECMEWTGAVRSSVPVVYVPGSYAWPGNSAGRQSVRSVLYCLANGQQLPAGVVIRAKCGNSLCVSEDCFRLFKRTEQAAEQGRRGELSTPRRRAARAKWARSKSKLTADMVAEIRSSDRPSRDEAKAYGVSYSTIVAIRSNQRWCTTVAGASVFSLGGRSG